MGSTGSVTVPQGVVETALLELLDRLPGGGGSGGGTGSGAAEDRSGVSVLDFGGGSGRFAVPLALAGARVTVVDLSVDALAILRRRAEEAGVAERIVAVQADVEALPPALARAQAALVLAHGVLEALPDGPEAGFAAVAGVVAPGGVLSVLVANPVAGVLAHALAGELETAEAELASFPDATSDRATADVMVGAAVGGPGPARATPDSVRALCARHGLVVEQVQGVGVFRDLVPGRALDAPGARDALARLEAACARRAPFADIAARVHVLARRPGKG